MVLYGNRHNGCFFVAGVFSFVAFLSYTYKARPEVELTFLRYSNQGRTDEGVGRAAFLLLTNRTSNTFMLCMPLGLQNPSS